MFQEQNIPIKRVVVTVTDPSNSWLKKILMTFDIENLVHQVKCLVQKHLILVYYN